MEPITPYRKKFKELWQTELTFAQIAAVLGVSERVLYMWRKELDLPLRGQGRRKL